jgi:pimeloyl-ACP methyl ester carboxylesterase
MQGADQPQSDSKTGTRAERNPFAQRSGPMAVPFLPRRGYADGPFGQLHYRDTGSGIPLLLCHQAPQTSKQFTRVFEPLHRRGIRAIAVDMPGYGESDPAPFVPTVEDWAGALPALLDALDIANVNLLGHHTGGLVATEAALQIPERVNKLIINGPIPMSDQARRASLEYVRDAEIEFRHLNDGSHLQAAFMTRYEMYGDEAEDEAETITRYTVERFQGYAPFWIGHHAAFLYDHAGALARLRVPTLILTNTGDQVYENALEAQRLRPDFEFKSLDGGGIDIVDQMPEAWADAVATFLTD